jgi:hypothetical protein
VTIEQDHENDILSAERRGAVDALRSAAAGWADVQVPDGRWSAGEIADWLSIKADLIAEGGDF